jgi:hypothetical protein
MLPPPAVSASTGFLIARLTRVIAVVYLLLAAAGTANAVVQKFISDVVSVTMPVQQFWPSLPSTVQLHGVSASVVGGGFSAARVEVVGLDGVARAWLAAGELAQGLTTVLLGVVVVILCGAVIRQDPFRPALTRAITVAAIGIIVGGVAWQICFVIGGGLASNQVLGITGWDYDTAQIDWDIVQDVTGLPHASNEWTVDFWPVAIGLTLLALAAVFRYGQRLQNESDHLI